MILQNSGFETTMFTLLIAAFLATNILSIVYMAMIAVGMGLQPGPRRGAWRFCFVPILGILLLFQYTALIGYACAKYCLSLRPLLSWCTCEHSIASRWLFCCNLVMLLQVLAFNEDMKLKGQSSVCFLCSCTIMQLQHFCDKP